MESSGGTRQTTQDETIEARVLSALDTTPRRPAEVAQGLEEDPETIIATMRRLLEGGRIRAVALDPRRSGVISWTDASFAPA